MRDTVKLTVCVSVPAVTYCLMVAMRRKLTASIYTVYSAKFSRISWVSNPIHEN